MSTAISEEIHHGTLGTLMTTPITGLQIVGGKLASRLWHLVVLLAISLPVLTLVRIFGGVSWTFVVSSTCITLSTALFLGSVSLYFSIFNRRSYSVVLKTIRTAVVLYALLPALLAMLTARSGGRGSMTILRILAYINPYFTMALATTDLQRPGSNPFAVSWQGSCGVVLAATALVLGVSVRIVRKVALRQATGEAGLFIRRRRRKREDLSLPPPLPASVAPPAGALSMSLPAATGEAMNAQAPAAKPRRARRTSKGIREITGSPVVWRELRQGTLRRVGVFSILGTCVLLGGLITMIAYTAWEGEMKFSEPHTIFVCILGLLGLLPTIMLAATGITTEKESRAWPLLLATPMRESKILWGKAVGIWRRCLPAWMPLALYVLVFTAVGLIHPIVPLCLALTAAGVIVFLTGTGLYLGTLLRRTTAAVTANICVALALWVLLPVLLIMAQIGGKEVSWAPVTALITWPNPGVQAGMITEKGSGELRNRHTTEIGWPGRLWPNPPPNSYDRSSQKMTLAQSAATIFTCTAGYTVLGLCSSGAPAGECGKTFSDGAAPAWRKPRRRLRLPPGPSTLGKSPYNSQTE
jgi:ABC-type transport system involved in multi-copper enzyme maturation permease subunit